MSAPKQSLMMEKLYGKVISKIVYERCQTLGEDFNRRVQEYVYDVIWAKSGIALKEKSIITVVSLIVSNKAEQLKIHFWGLFHQGVGLDEVASLLKYIPSKSQSYFLHHTFCNVRCLR